MYITYSKTAKLKRCGLGVTNHWTELRDSHIFTHSEVTFVMSLKTKGLLPIVNHEMRTTGREMHFSGNCKISNSAHADFLLVSNNLQLLF